MEAFFDCILIENKICKNTNHVFGFLLNHCPINIMKIDQVRMRFNWRNDFKVWTKKQN